MTNTYTIECYKHIITPDFEHIPVPASFDHREYTITAQNEADALRQVEHEYGSIERIEDGKYATNPDGSWTLTNIKHVKVGAF